MHLPAGPHENLTPEVDVRTWLSTAVWGVCIQPSCKQVLVYIAPVTPSKEINLTYLRISLCIEVLF